MDPYDSRRTLVLCVKSVARLVSPRICIADARHVFSTAFGQDNTRVQPPVRFPIGDHVNVLHDYKKRGP